MPTQPKIIFLHIPKTAGMSLHGLFIRNYRGRCVFNTQIKDIDYLEWQGCLDRLKCIPSEEQDQFAALKGHMIFGLHEHVSGPVEYITFLRDPVRRIISHYRMVRASGTFADPDHMIDPARSLWNFAEYPAFHRALDNYQTRALAGIDFELPFGSCTQEHLDLAKANLDRHFKFVGLTEQFDLSLMLMAHVLGWRRRFYVPDNVACQEMVQVPKTVIEALGELNRFDYDLYSYAQEKFNGLVEHYGWKLKAECAVYKFGNKLHLRYHRYRHKVKRFFGIERRPAMA